MRFPGWTAVEIHAALNEEALSAETSAVLERVGTVLGSGKAPARTTTRCWARSVGGAVPGATRKAGQRAVRKAGREGELRGKAVTIEGLLGHQVPWSTIEAATGIDEPAFRRLKRALAAAAGHKADAN